MKKVLIATVSMLAAAGIASSAAAQAPVYTKSIVTTLEAEVASICGIRFNNDVAAVIYDFGELSGVDAATFAPQQGGGISALCNDVDGYSVTYESANNGFLTLNGAPTTASNRRIEWQMSGSNPGRGGFGSQAQLSAPKTVNSGAFTTSASMNTQYFVKGVRVQDAGNPGNPQAFTTNVFAGDYSDVVTISVAAR